MPMVAKGLGKLLEECGELVEVAAEKLAFSLTDVRPAGRESLTARLEEEVADVRAASVLVSETLDLDESAIAGHAAACRRGQPGLSEALRGVIEACGALVQVSAKKLAYFHTDVHPDGKGSLKARMEQALGNVRGASTLIISKAGLAETAIEQRAFSKLRLFHSWEAAQDNNRDGVDRDRIQ